MKTRKTVPQSDEPSGGFFAEIRARDLCVLWVTATKLLNEANVLRIIEDFDPHAMGLLVVTLPDKNGKRHIIDGQHRKAAVERMYGPNTILDCWVIPTTDPAVAARIWLKINANRFRARSLDEFFVRLTAREPIACAINDIAEHAGYQIADARAPGFLRAVKSCERVYKKGGVALLASTLRTLKGCWPGDGAATDGSVISGMAAFLAAHQEHVDLPALIARLPKKCSPTGLLVQSRATRAVTGGSTTDTILRLLLCAHNSGLRANRLPEPK